MTEAQKSFQCTPCGRKCDSVNYDSSGICKSCQMPLVKKESIRFSAVEPANVCTFINQHPQLILLDVRTPEEFAGRADPDFGSLANAINIPVNELETRITEIESFKEKEFLVYCSHSHRSPVASYLLSKHGFLKIYNLNGGMSEVPASSSCLK